MNNRPKEILTTIGTLLFIVILIFIIVFCATSAALKNNARNSCLNLKYYEEANPNTISNQNKHTCYELTGIEI